MFGPVISWDTMRTLYLYERVFVIFHVGCEKKFIALKVFLNIVNAL